MSAQSAYRAGVNGLRRLPERIPLRVKLVVALLALVAVALTVISAASVLFFRGYLTNQADQQIDVTFQQLVQDIQTHQSLPMQPGDVRQIGTTVIILRPPSGKLDPRDQLPSSMPIVPSQPSWLSGHPQQLVTVPGTGGTSWRVITDQLQQQVIDPFSSQVLGTQHVTLIVGENLGTVNATIGRLIEIDVIASLVIMTALAMAGVAAVRGSLRPLTDMEHTARAIAAGDLSRRVPDRDPRTEVGSLGRSLNAMLTQIESAFRAQARSEAAARQSEERMRQFVADASHELRTPLTAIRGYAEYYRQRGGLANGKLSAGQQASEALTGAAAITGADMNRIMERVEQESARMGVLVEDLLLLARLDQQRPLERKPVDLLTLAADAVQDARMVAPKRAIDLTVGAGTAFLVLGDEVRLRQVIGNLMSNALTHTPEDTGVHVRLAVASGLDPGAPPAAELVVADEGPGMSREQAEHVFERFYRADAARNRRNGGTGLGLAIVAALVASHGGTVAVDTAPGQGAAFRITLPLAPETQEA